MSASQELAGLGGDVLFFKNNLVNQKYLESELNNNTCCPHFNCECKSKQLCLVDLFSSSCLGPFQTRNQLMCVFDDGLKKEICFFVPHSG